MAGSGSITGANSVISLAVRGLFPVPLSLKGFAADDVFDTDELESAETYMGVDGNLSAGFVFVPVHQRYALQADSPSTFLFDTWWAAQQMIQDIYYADGIVRLNTVGKKWTMTKGVLSGYKPIPDAKKLLQPQRFRITWERIFPTII